MINEDTGVVKQCLVQFIVTQHNAHCFELLYPLISTINQMLAYSAKLWQWKSVTKFYAWSIHETLTSKTLTN